MSTLTIQIQRGKKTNFVMTGKNNIKNTFLLLQVFNYQTVPPVVLCLHTCIVRLLQVCVACTVTDGATEMRGKATIKS